MVQVTVTDGAKTSWLFRVFQDNWVISGYNSDLVIYKVHIIIPNNLIILVIFW